MEGTQQSGVAFNLRIANLASDGVVLQAARDEAQRILDEDYDLTTPDDQLLQRNMRFLFSRETNWGMIS